MMSNIVKVLVGLAVSVVFFLLGMQVKSAEYRSPFTEDSSDPRIRHYQVESEYTGINYPVHVFLPNDYSNQKEKYPVIYATDGQWLADIYTVTKEKDIILVAIEQGPENRRFIDYGQDVGAYFNFLTKELLPFVEDKYRVDSGQRAVVGTSLGGFFVGYALLVDNVDAPYFSIYAAFDGAFWFASPALQNINKARRDLSGKMNATVFLTGTRRGNERHVRRFHRDLENAGYEGLEIIRSTYWVRHVDITYPSVVAMVEALY